MELHHLVDDLEEWEDSVELVSHQLSLRVCCSARQRHAGASVQHVFVLLLDFIAHLFDESFALSLVKSGLADLV